jgi:beta-lactamase superfamily II metal-dependent hydrolase
MKRLLLRNFGDGLSLCLSDSRFYRNSLTIDYGGDENLIDDYWDDYFYDSFLLSHFHSDHYNGILYFDDTHNWHIDKFYFPRMPKFADDRLFYFSLLAANIRLNNNHPIQSSILNHVQSINRKPISFIPLSQGEHFVYRNQKFEILWPPEELKEAETLKTIRIAIKDFEEAKETDSELREIYEGVVKKYKDRDINSVNKNEEVRKRERNYIEPNKTLLNANDSLRKAANRLSIAFKQADNLLFLGDLEKKEIKSVINNLVSADDKYFEVLITPHHGTHWDDSLKSIKAKLCLVSVGTTLRKHVKYEFKEICNKMLRTDELGDIIVKRKLVLK